MNGYLPRYIVYVSKSAWYLLRFVLLLFENYLIAFDFQIMDITESFSNLTLMEQINKTDSIVTTLANITIPTEESQFPQELRTVVNIISDINK